MSRRSLVITSIVGLVFAIVASALVRLTIEMIAISFVVLVLVLVAAAIAARVLLGSRPVHRYFKLAVPLFSAIAGFAFETALSNWLISQHTAFGPPPAGLPGEVIVALIIGAVAYLVAATLYGFAGTRQGVKVGARVGLLLLLLLSVLPLANVLGLIGFLITSLVRKTGETAATPAPPEASE